MGAQLGDQRAGRRFAEDEAQRQFRQALPFREDWRIERVTAKQARPSAASGHIVLLGLDRIQSFYTDPNRADRGLNYGLLTLHVQIIVRGWPMSKPIFGSANGLFNPKRP